jgi:pyruvate formate-lyase activating enzyme-like uncharacterized protein
MVPCKAVFLSEDEYYATLMAKQDALLKLVEEERKEWQVKVDACTKHHVLVVERNEQFTKDMVKLRARAAKAVSDHYKSMNRVTVSVWVGWLAVAAAWTAAVTAGGVAQ